MNLPLINLVATCAIALTKVIANSKPNINYNGCNIVRINSYGERSPFDPGNRINRRAIKRW